MAAAGRRAGEVPPPGSLTSPDGRALLVDYAGVLTPGVADGWRRFEQRHGMPASTVSQLLWAAYGEGQRDNPVARVERGELDVGEFERHFAAAMAARGFAVEPDGLIERLFEDLQPAGGMWDLVREVRVAGVPAVLVSNSWGFSGYPDGLLRATFDDVVISGRLGVRKPERGIFEHAAMVVGAVLSGCVLVDDGRPNVEAAEAYGMTGVLHEGDDDATRTAVLAALGLG